jgi:hypothetical protein
MSIMNKIVRIAASAVALTAGLGSPGRGHPPSHTPIPRLRPSITGAPASGGIRAGAVTVKSTTRATGATVRGTRTGADLRSGSGDRASRGSAGPGNEGRGGSCWRGLHLAQAVERAARGSRRNSRCETVHVPQRFPPRRHDDDRVAAQHGSKDAGGELVWSHRPHRLPEFGRSSSLAPVFVIRSYTPPVRMGVRIAPGHSTSFQSSSV